MAGGQRLLLKFLCDSVAAVETHLSFVLFSLLPVEEVLKKHIIEMLLSKAPQKSEKED